MDEERKAAMRAVAVGGWVLVFGAMFAWQGIGMATSSGWPAMSDMLRPLTNPILGRWVLFGLWLWLGWHLFIRGWEFFMENRL